MKEDWTEQLRKKLEGHEATPPEGLWEDICKEMGLTPKSVSKPATYKRLYWAAAIVLALAGFFAYYQFDDNKIFAGQQYTHTNQRHALAGQRTAIACEASTSNHISCFGKAYK